MPHTTIPDPKALARIRYRDLRVVLGKTGLFTHEDVVPFIDPSNGCLVITEGSDCDSAAEPYCDAFTDWIPPDLIYVELKWAHRLCHGYGEPQHYFRFEASTGTWHPVSESEGREIHMRCWETVSEFPVTSTPIWKTEDVNRRIDELRQKIRNRLSHTGERQNHPGDSVAARIDDLRAQIRSRKPIENPPLNVPVVDQPAARPAAGDPPWKFPPIEVVPNPKAAGKIRWRGVEGVHDWYGRFSPERVTPFIDSHDGALVYTDGEGEQGIDHPHCDTCVVWWLPAVVSMSVSWWSDMGGSGELDDLLFFIFDESSDMWSPLSGQSPLVQELRGVTRKDESRGGETLSRQPLNSELELE